MMEKNMVTNEMNRENDESVFNGFGWTKSLEIGPCKAVEHPSIAGTF